VTTTRKPITIDLTAEQAGVLFDTIMYRLSHEDDTPLHEWDRLDEILDKLKS